MQPAEAQYFPQHIDTLVGHFTDSLAGLGYAGVALYSGTPHIAFLDDYHFPFKPNPLFAWWGPMSQPECWIWIEPDRRPQLIYLQPADYWHATPQDPAGFWVEHFDIHVVRTPQEARRLLPLDSGHAAVIGEALPDWNFAAVNPQDLINRLHWRRAGKTDYELECMRAASRLGCVAHLAAAEAFAAGATEYQIHLKYMAACGHAEKELPYNNIIALNENAAILHYQHLERVSPAQRRTFLIDAGASYGGYAADITRTWVNQSDDFSNLVAAMDERQQQMVAGVTHGRSFADLHLDCHRHLAELLAEFDIVNCSADDALELGLTATFMPHGLGHLIGLQVHDVGGHMADDSGAKAPPPERFAHLRTTRTLQEGYVVTIEPGLYFIPMLLDELRQGPHAARLNWARVDEFKPYGGIRIEDDVVTTRGAPENLTRDAFQAIAA